MKVGRVWPVLLALGLTPGMAWSASRPNVAWTYTVRPGDTIASVAARMAVSPGDLARANAISLDTPLVPGTVLKRPNPDGMPAGNARPPRRPPAPRRSPGRPRRRGLCQNPRRYTGRCPAPRT